MENFTGTDFILGCSAIGAVSDLESDRVSQPDTVRLR